METTATDLPQLDEIYGKIKRADQLIKLAMLAIAVAVIVLVIDNGIKRRIVAEGERALKVLAEAQRIVREADSGQGPAGEATASPGDSVNPDHGLDDAAGTSAEPGGDAGNGLGPETGRVARPFGGPRGDG